MKFYVTRTSASGDEVKPCDEATPGTYTRVDRRNVDDLRKIPASRRDPERAEKEWYGDGGNHRIEQGCLVRDMGLQEAWTIEMDSIEALWAFAQKYGEVIVRAHWNNGEPELEIYDTYRE